MLRRLFFGTRTPPEPRFTAADGIAMIHNPIISSGIDAAMRAVGSAAKGCGVRDRDLVFISVIRGEAPADAVQRAEAAWRQVVAGTDQERVRLDVEFREGRAVACGERD